MLFLLAVTIFLKCMNVDIVCARSETIPPTAMPTPIIDWFTTTKIPSFCKQSQIHLQQHFCDSNRAVVKAKIIQRLNDYDYSIKVLRVFRGHFELINKKRLFNNKFCPADFIIGKVYLITGELNFDGSNFEFHTSRGHWIENFNTVSVIQKFGLRRYYKETCGIIRGLCEIKSCSGEDCSEKDVNACKMDKNWSKSVTYCYTHKSACRRPRKRCVWRSWNVTKDENGRSFHRINCN